MHIIIDDSGAAVKPALTLKDDGKLLTDSDGKMGLADDTLLFGSSWLDNRTGDLCGRRRVIDEPRGPDRNTDRITRLRRHDLGFVRNLSAREVFGRRSSVIRSVCQVLARRSIGR